MLKISDLAFSYSNDDCKVFNDFSLSIEKGAVYGLLGLNGTGKSTLLYLLTGLLRPQQGSVLYKGEDVKLRLPSTLSDMFIVPEEFELPKMSIKKYASLHSGFYPNFSYEQLTQNLAMFGLDDSVVFNSLSMGQQKKAFMCYALATNTSLLVMDEPTNGLDIPSKSTFRKVVASAITDDKAFIISTHQVRDLQNVIDAVLVLDRGEILLNADINTICDRLTFKVLSANEYNELSAQGKVLYSEDNIAGKVTVCTHIDDADDKFDMELLFCATISAREKMHEIFAENENGKSRFASEMETKLNN